MNLITQLERIEKHLRNKSRSEELLIVGFNPSNKKLMNGNTEFNPPADFQSDKYKLLIVVRGDNEVEVNEAVERLSQKIPT